ncbi:hypothetical protein PVAP13_8NG191202 [Panicum virgatum]|uniref:Uncharacterized protein n=1 Tax=Panicum virgatum TaxID=38727 RepID=A0A8T0P7G1_PANVG|nr:hypothetical protein PVAP13_8NG191202 [Panicum virgatum]
MKMNCIRPSHAPAARRDIATSSGQAYSGQHTPVFYGSGAHSSSRATASSSRTQEPVSDEEEHEEDDDEEGEEEDEDVHSQAATSARGHGWDNWPEEIGGSQLSGAPPATQPSQGSQRRKGVPRRRPRDHTDIGSHIRLDTHPGRDRKRKDPYTPAR